MKLTLSTVVSGLALVSTSTSTVAANKAFSASSKAPVDVTLFVMSRCPDAVKCEGVFSKVFQAENLPTVNPSLSFIGSINRSSKTSFSTSEDGTTVTCKHGPLECAGNTQQLCFKKYFPDHEIWVPFVVAMNSLAFHRIGDPEYAREIGEKVLYEGGQNIFYTYHEADHLLEKVDDCSKGQEGFDLLVESIQHTIDHGVG
ncbi:hypothetical protein EDD11_004944 [Mortierella claussenii]|nr:hypothetical protein EDD11_004944 [Mortierella claussenii]